MHVPRVSWWKARYAESARTYINLQRFGRTRLSRQAIGEVSRTPTLAR